jgi:hypothetical protein
MVRHTDRPVGPEKQYSESLWNSASVLLFVEEKKRPRARNAGSRVTTRLHVFVIGNGVIEQ